MENPLGTRAGVYHDLNVVGSVETLESFLKFSIFLLKVRGVGSGIWEVETWKLDRGARALVVGVRSSFTSLWEMKHVCVSLEL